MQSHHARLLKPGLLELQASLEQRAAVSDTPYCTNKKFNRSKNDQVETAAAWQVQLPP